VTFAERHTSSTHRAKGMTATAVQVESIVIRRLHHVEWSSYLSWKMDIFGRLRDYLIRVSTPYFFSNLSLSFGSVIDSMVFRSPILTILVGPIEIRI
jgi:hypothetical protein